MTVEPLAYSATAKTFHWLMVIVIFTTIPIGISLERLPEGSFQNTMFDVHRSLGAVILFLALLRLANRLVRGTPRPDRSLAPHERILSGLVHKTLYLLMIVVPLLGWAATSAYGAPVTVFWLFELPPLLAKNQGLATTLFTVHKVAALTMGGLILLHIAGALMHAFRRDGVVSRMLPAR
jgi:cytochrome b561